MPLPKLNRALLAKVLHHIEEEPLRFYMGMWAGPSTQAPCGTQACLAGWAYILSRPDQKTAMEIAKSLADRSYSGAFNSLIFKKAQKELGLTTDEARALFLTRLWDRGATGVEAARKKINLLLKDRGKFVSTYGPQV